MIEVIIEAVQFTPGRQPVIVLYAGRGVRKGPLATTQLFSTTQKELAGNPPGGVDEELVWGDKQVVDLLAAHLEESGITASVVLQEPDPEPTPEAKAAQNITVSPAKQ